MVSLHMCSEGALLRGREDLVHGKAPDVVRKLSEVIRNPGALPMLGDEVRRDLDVVNVDRYAYLAQVCFHQRSHLVPIQVAVAAAERREGSRGDAQLAVCIHELSQATFDIVEL